MPHEVIVTAPSRLHFGLFALAAPVGATDVRSYGGVGVMVDSPLNLQLRITPGPGFEVADGPLAERVRSFARRWSEFYSQPLDGVQLSLLRATPDHIGLGTGTQLGLSVAAGLCAFRGFPVPPIEELARSVGRGGRSAVGAYGFALGGLIVDRGKLPGELLSPLDCRLELPADWRFVLARPLQGSGLAGEREQSAMAAANRNLQPLTEQLVTEAREHLIPAAACRDFPAFAASLGRYCETAGKFYADVQGGLYNGPAVTALAEAIRQLGHIGLGQSSWGPTLFVACEHSDAANQLAGQLRDSHSPDEVAITIASPRNTPAQIEVH
jgi:beta-ribofuranosylaminobenzene 5'-phosphate synthase